MMEASDGERMRILGLDVGEKRTGTALSDELGITAQGLETLEASDSEGRKKKVLDLIRKVRPEKVVVGLPRNMDGSLGPQARMVMAFAEEIARESGLTVDTWDERLSTVEADEILRSSHVKQKKRKKVRDILSAVLILQGYLDNLRSHH